MSDPQIVITESADLLNYPPTLLAALVNVECECPRGESGMAHIFDFYHRQGTDHTDPFPHIYCVGKGAPLEFKELHPWHSIHQDALLDEHIEWVRTRSKK